MNKDHRKQFVDDLLRGLVAEEFYDLYHRFIELYDEVGSCLQLLTRETIGKNWAEEMIDRSFADEEWKQIWKQIRELLEDWSVKPFTFQ